MLWLGSLGRRSTRVELSAQIEIEMRQDCAMFQVCISLYKLPPESTHPYLRIFFNIITPVANEGDVQLYVRTAA